MRVGTRGQSLAGLAALVALCLTGSGCQTGRIAAPMADIGGVKPSNGVIAQFKAMSLAWNPSGAKSSPTATIHKTPGTNVSGYTPVARGPEKPAPTGIQPASARQTGEPPSVVNIPVTAQPNQTPVSFVPPAGTKISPLPLGPVAPVGPYGPVVVSTQTVSTPVIYAPPPGPVARTMQGISNGVHGKVATIKAKVNDLRTDDVIKYAAPVPHGVPKEFEKRSLPPYIIEPPDILLIETTAELKGVQPIAQQHLVRPDGTVSLGVYGEAYVAGKTIAQAKEIIIQVLSSRLKEVKENNTNVDILAYNSKKYYVITDGGGNGEAVYSFPITGNETVLDALANIYGLPTVASKKNIWIARATPDGSPLPKILPVEWQGITQYGSASTNYQVMPGDRIYVKADNWVTRDTWLARRLAPFERVLGAILLGSGAANSLQGGGNNQGR